MSYIDVFRMFIIDQYDYEIGHPASEEEIAAFEQHYNIRFPDDMREYLLKINGVLCDFHDFMSIEPLSSWYESSEYGQRLRRTLGHLSLPANYFLFGHYESFSVKWFAVLNHDAQAETPIYAYYRGRTDESFAKIADSFTEFIVIFGGPNEFFRLGYRPRDL
jgi:hypothetical protein